MPDPTQAASPGTIVAIELTNRCNLQCAYCPQGKVAIPWGDMDRQTLLAAISHCRGYTELNWRGESLLHPQCLEMVELARRAGPELDLGFHTNGLLVSEDVFDALVQIGLDWMHVSLHTEAACDKYLQMKSWNRDRGEPVRLQVEADTAMEEMVARSLGVPGGEILRQHVANWAGFLTGYRTIYPDAAQRAAACCLIRENKFLVAWDGTVNACCWDFECRHALGHVRDFERIRHRPPYELCDRCLWIIAGREEA